MFLPDSPGFLVGADKCLNRPVVGPFHIVREKAGGHLIHPHMVLETLAAFAFPAAWFITAITVFHVL
jgi:hypothetical protein